MENRQAIGRILTKVEGWFDPKEAYALYDHAITFDKGRFVEIGSYRGRSALVLGLAAQTVGGKVFAIDPHEEHSEVNERNPAMIASFGAADNEAMLTNIVQYNLGRYIFPVSLPSADAFIDNIDMLFIDGAHDERSAVQDLLLWQRRMKSSSVLAIHDNYWSGPIKCKEILEKSPDFTLVQEADSTMFFKRSPTENAETFWMCKANEYSSYL